MIQLLAMNCHVQRVTLGFRREAKHGKERSRDCIRTFFILPGFLMPILHERTELVGQEFSENPISLIYHTYLERQIVVQNEPGPRNTRIQDCKGPPEKPRFTPCSFMMVVKSIKLKCLW